MNYVPQAIPIFFCICSNEISFVSGYHHRTTKNWTTIISAKNRKGNPPEDAAMTGKIPEMKAFITQCAVIPE
jgi:hypothetical protein